MKIEKNIPMPVRNKTRELAADMEVNDSVFFDDCDKKGRSRSNYLRAELRKLARQGITRSVDGGYRVWRVK